MYRVIYDSKFDKSLNKLIKNGLKKNVQDEIKETVKIISSGKKLSVLYRDHKLNGEYEGFRECHIQGDLLLVYKIVKSELVLVLVDIGSHSELF